jgi:Zn-dependent peptidase ImmA (M78 family)
MADRATGINPDMLRWAREQAGYATVESVAARLKRPAAQIEAWESGDEFPTWRQLEQLARDLYHRPIALFFLPVPPEERFPSAEFRRLPEAAFADLEPDTWMAIRQARARLIDLEELASFDDSLESQIVRDLSEKASPYDVDSLAHEARAYLDVSLDEQFTWNSVETALDHWRDAVQTAGVWVFKRHFRQFDVAGFCLCDPQRPLMVLNNGQPKVRQIFTLFHELAHLLFEFNHLERFNIGHYVDELEGRDREVEIACNRFAGEFLVPTSHFREFAAPRVAEGITDDTLDFLARKYRVSREVALRKCLNQTWVDQLFYDDKVREWRAQSHSNSEASGGGNYYANQGTYLGAKYTELAFRGFYQGAYDIDQLSEYLGVKSSNIDGIESWLNQRLARA